MPGTSTEPSPAPTFGECYRFPISSAEGRRDVIVGGLLVMCTGPIGFVLCMGHRLHVLRRLVEGEHPAFYGFRPFGFTFRRGLSAVAAILCYLVPGLALMATAWFIGGPGPLRMLLAAFGLVLFGLGLYALPGGMTHNAIHDDMAVLLRPDRALGIAADGGTRYLKAWVIGWSAVAIAYASLLLLVVPFFFVSVWAWSVAGFAFTRALIPEADLSDASSQPASPRHSSISSRATPVR